MIQKPFKSREVAYQWKMRICISQGCESEGRVCCKYSGREAVWVENGSPNGFKGWGNKSREKRRRGNLQSTESADW